MSAKEKRRDKRQEERFRHAQYKQTLVQRCTNHEDKGRGRGRRWGQRKKSGKREQWSAQGR